MTVKMHEIQKMGEMWRRGDSVARTARAAGRSEPTVRKYLAEADLSPTPPGPTARRESRAGAHGPVVRGGGPGRSPGAGAGGGPARLRAPSATGAAARRPTGPCTGPWGACACV